ncbi:MAG TPA: hypothetical protein DF383_08435 [Deltaproteobacteria bacterium]|nr:hypothetical protein [Deltaproteobacteria bacterium]
MKKASISQVIDQPCERVFDLLHDYEIRLEWDNYFAGPTCSMHSLLFHFEAKPRYLAWLLEPILNLCLRKETKQRLQALKNFLERSR